MASAVLRQAWDWETYWRKTNKLLKIYKSSKEELADIKQAYLNFRDDMDQLTKSLLCAVHRGTQNMEPHSASHSHQRGPVL